MTKRESEFAKIGGDLRRGGYNAVIGAFAAELIGESYPLSEPNTIAVFKNYSDAQLGEKFLHWADRE